MPLTDRQIKALAHPANGSSDTNKAMKRSDGGGLYIELTPRGSKLWRMNYRFGGKQRTVAFGSYPTVSLADARRKRDDAKELVANGIDPSAHAKAEKVRQAVERADTFGTIAGELIDKKEREGRAGATLDKQRWLLDLARPSLGNRPIREITAADILTDCLRPIEDRGTHETAKRLRSFIGEAFRYAIATGRAENDPSSALRGALTAPIVNHRAALTERGAFAGLVAAIWGYRPPVTRTALQLLALLYPRPSELREARWDEFDLDKAEWTIPAARAKMRRPHRKPLSPLAVTLLRELRPITGYSDFVFASSQNARKPISENTLNNALSALGYGKGIATAHGFRASASTLQNESGLWNSDAVEVEQGRRSGGAVRNAYHRGSYWDERVRMAAWWADEIEAMRAEASVEPEAA